LMEILINTHVTLLYFFMWFVLCSCSSCSLFFCDCHNRIENETGVLLFVSILRPLIFLNWKCCCYVLLSYVWFLLIRWVNYSS
jgi:hypothetical protein